MSFVTPETAFSEAKIVWIAGLIQFVLVIDFMIVMPLGPDFARDLGIPLHHLGYIGGSYTMAACLTGLVAALFLDKFDRKLLLLQLLLGLSAATLLAALAHDFMTLIFARILAGVFGGPLSATAIALIADVIPSERRGAAMGKFMSAFSIASILGVPFGLELARVVNWQFPFLVLGFAIFIVYAYARYSLPSNINMLAMDDVRNRMRRLIVTMRNPLSQVAWMILGIGTLSGFLLIPNLATFMQYNMGYPREKLGMLYLFGGAVSFFSTRYVGRLTDRFGATQISMLCSLLYIGTIICGFVVYPLIHMPVILIFVLFMVSTSARNVASQTITSKVPLPIERASFMSVQSAVTHAGSAIGAFLGSVILIQEPNSQMLSGMHAAALTSCVIGIFVPVMVSVTERLLARRAAREPSVPIQPVV